MNVVDFNTVDVQLHAKSVQVIGKLGWPLALADVQESASSL